MKISVIIPTYKPQNYLWECLESLKMQTFPKGDFEIILVLNGCNEPYYSHIEDYLSLNMSDNVVNFIHVEQGGVSNARNVALNCARGEYIAFVDDDDFISPSYLEELYAKMHIIKKCKKTKEIRVICNADNAVIVSKLLSLGADAIFTPFAYRDHPVRQAQDA